MEKKNNDTKKPLRENKKDCNKKIIQHNIENMLKILKECAENRKERKNRNNLARGVIRFTSHLEKGNRKKEKERNLI